MTNACLTICSINYLPKALVLADSYIVNNPADDFYLLLTDRKINSISVPENVNLLWVEDLGIKNWERYAFSYDVIEFNTNVKPYTLLKLLEKYENVMYLDPDIQVFSSLNSVWEELTEQAILVTPHYFEPILDGHKPDDLELLKFGTFNLGFVAVSNKPDAVAFLHWWSDRCLEFGYYEPQSGLGVDQKWVTIAPSFFKSMKVSFDAGLNLAFWNLHERSISTVNDKLVVNNDVDLKFIHFSSFDEKNPGNIAKKQDRFAMDSRPDFVVLAKDYAAKLKSKSESYSFQDFYSFDYFEDGAYITPALRRFYSNRRHCDTFNDGSPFAMSGNVRRFAEKHRLVIKDYKPGQRLNFKNLNDASKAVKVINFFLKVTLRILGPLNYFNLMRYLAHISSIRHQKDLLK
ncbi:Glycosyl transferase family 8 [Rheinheimera sp. A13L]|uniref:glycosyl transferase n=1 Tax=Rheinheimera sp. A13L TaxID=506534 RepID=UPI00021254AD|nr:glycosyl transferase [Rheinheimera sp. A13L]EGM78169.1 Glycosyl transferase family 8 [Rheinheimera sp. A13L]